MELKQYFFIFKKNLKFFILFLILGLIAGYIYSIYQVPVYQASTKVLIMQSPENRSLDILNQSEKQLAQTFIELLTTRPIIQTTAEQLDTEIDPRNIQVQQVKDAELIEVIVQDSDPQLAAKIANTLVNVFVEKNEELQNSRFLASEESLQAQIQQVEQQMNNLQTQSQDSLTNNLNDQLNAVTIIITDIQDEIRTLEEEVAILKYQKEPVMAPLPSGINALMTPTPTIEERIEVINKENRLAELKTLLTSYQSLYVNLSFPSSNFANNITMDSQQNQAAIDLYQQIYENLLSNYEAVRLSRVKDVSNIVQVEAAIPPENPVSPRTLINVLFGGVLALLLTGSIVFVIEYLDDSLKTPEEISTLFDAPILGYIGEIPTQKNNGTNQTKPFIAQKPRSVFAESFRTLRTNLEFSSIDNPLKTILITSSTRGEGKTTIACNLATSIAQSGKSVILIDADLRCPRVHQEMGLLNRIGLSDLLRNTANFETTAQETTTQNLKIITSGSLPPNPMDVLNSEKMQNILKEIKQTVELVIIDGPPFILADASVLATKVDGNLIVVYPNHTSGNTAILMIDQLERINANIIGVVLNRVQVNNNYYYQELEEYSSN
jgi:capsular exopolysaccharide synthesis family protein